MEDYLRFHENRQLAILYAIALNFEHRKEGRKYHIVNGPSDEYEDWAIVSTSVLNELESLSEPLPRSIEHISFEAIEQLFASEKETRIWDEIIGTLQQMSGETLRFVIHHNLPWEKFMRYELSSRGYDEDEHWVGFEKAREIWFEQQPPSGHSKKTNNME